MIRQDKFPDRKTLYAVRLDSLSRKPYEVTPYGAHSFTPYTAYRYTILAVWFKRRKGLDTSNIGYLSCHGKTLYEESNPDHARLFLSSTLTDGRYGADCATRWDGENAWSVPALNHSAHLANVEFLSSMLDNFPAIPQGYDGWWRF